jgi:hypothetical protein
MRREIEVALDSQRNIVPVILAGFNFGTSAIASQLTGKLAALKKYNGLEIPRGYFAPAMERLRNKFLSVSLDTVLHPASLSAQQAATEQKDKATMAEFAVVCSNATRAGKYDDFLHTVIDALREADHSSIIPDVSEQIRLIPLQEDISRADTVIVVCFDQEWNWANRITQQLSVLLGEQSAKTKIFIIGPEYRKNKGKFTPGFNFRTIVGVTPDNHVSLNHVADEIKKIVGGPAALASLDASLDHS